MRNRRIFDDVMFSDESLFTNKGLFNRHNTRMWEAANPHWVQFRQRYTFSVMVWGGIIGTRVIGPYFFEENINGEVYANFITEELPRLLAEANVPPQVRQRMIFQHDGAGPHRDLRVIQLLDENYPNRWMGNGGPIPWPPYSPDLTCLDFFLWGYVKEYVYNNSPRNEEHLRELITEGFARVTVQQLRRVQNSFIERIQLCIDLEGDTFENIIKCKACNYLKEM